MAKQAHFRPFPAHSNELLKARAPAPVVHWLWDGVLAKRAITLLAAPEKTGKTTLISLLLDRLRAGGQLLGRTVNAGRTVLCSEEENILWALRQPPLDFGPQLRFCRPDRPTRRSWHNFIDTVYGFGQDFHAPDFDLLVVDSVMSFFPCGQNDPKWFRWALRELRDISNLPTAVLLGHQMSAAKSRSRVRGPLAASADIIIDMQIPPGSRFTRSRTFTGVGRYPGTLQYISAELNAEGTDYSLLSDDPRRGASIPTLQTVCDILRHFPEPLTRQELLTRWPNFDPAPRPDSLWRTLTRACEEGILLCSGTGTRLNAFRYALIAK